MSNRKAKRKILKESPSGSPPKADQPRAGKTNKIIVILGPTASGKTKLAIKLARLFSGEIVSADSRQVYRKLDLGTGKDLKEYGKIPHHLIDVISPKKQFSLAEWQKLAYLQIDRILKRGKVPFLVGGSGLYLQSITDGYILSNTKPQKKLRLELSKKNLNELQKLSLKLKIKLNHSDFNNKRRLIRAIELKKGPAQLLAEKNPRYECLILGIKTDKLALNARIDSRLSRRLNQGMVAEAANLKKSGLSLKRLDDFGLEYRYLVKFLRDEMTYGEMRQKLAREIKHFAKRQMTWFKRMDNIQWIKSQKKAVVLISKFLN